MSGLFGEHFKGSSFSMGARRVRSARFYSLLTAWVSGPISAGFLMQPTVLALFNDPLPEHLANLSYTLGAILLVPTILGFVLSRKSR
jgi:uncharacterized membrane protein